LLILQLYYTNPSFNASTMQYTNTLSVYQSVMTNDGNAV